MQSWPSDWPDHKTKGSDHWGGGVSHLCSLQFRIKVTSTKSLGKQIRGSITLRRKWLLSGNTQIGWLKPFHHHPFSFFSSDQERWYSRPLGTAILEEWRSDGVWNSKYISVNITLCWIIQRQCVMWKVLCPENEWGAPWASAGTSPCRILPHSPHVAGAGLSPQGRCSCLLWISNRWGRGSGKDDLNPSESMPLRCRPKLAPPEKRLSLTTTGIWNENSWWLFLPLLGASLSEKKANRERQSKKWRDRHCWYCQSSWMWPMPKALPVDFSMRWVNNFLVLLKPVWLGFLSLIIEISPE